MTSVISWQILPTKSDWRCDFCTYMVCTGLSYVFDVHVLGSLFAIATILSYKCKQCISCLIFGDSCGPQIKMIQMDHFQLGLFRYNYFMMQLWSWFLQIMLCWMHSMICLQTKEISWINLLGISNWLTVGKSALVFAAVQEVHMLAEGADILCLKKTNNKYM